jgi:hypothetical protein
MNKLQFCNKKLEINAKNSIYLFILSIKCAKIGVLHTY